MSENISKSVGLIARNISKSVPLSRESLSQENLSLEVLHQVGLEPACTVT